MAKRIIKVTENQLKETEGQAFKYLDTTNDYTPFNGNTEISVSGNIDGMTPGSPITGDYIGKQLTPQTYNRYRAYGNTYPRSVRENEELDTVDKRNPELDTLSDGDDSDDITRIPNTVHNKLDIFIQSLQGMTPKQIAMCLNEIIESFDLSQLPLSWRKDLISKLNIMSNGSESPIK